MEKKQDHMERTGHRGYVLAVEPGTTTYRGRCEECGELVSLESHPMNELKTKWSPAEYVQAWDWQQIHATARLGIADYDYDALRACYGPGNGARCAQDLVDYCRRRVREDENE